MVRPNTIDPHYYHYKWFAATYAKYLYWLCIQQWSCILSDLVNGNDFASSWDMGWNISQCFPFGITTRSQTAILVDLNRMPHIWILQPSLLNRYPIVGCDCVASCCLLKAHLWDLRRYKQYLLLVFLPYFFISKIFSFADYSHHICTGRCSRRLAVTTTGSRCRWHGLGSWAHVICLI